MSHYAIVSINIKDPDKKLLEKALKHVAEKIGAELKTNAYVKSYYQRYPIKVDYLLKMNLHAGNGFGIKIEDDGSVSVIGDDYNSDIKVDDIQKALGQEYTFEALKESLEELGFGYEVERNKDTIEIYVSEV